MDIVLKNVKKKDFPILKSLSKSLGFEIEQTERPDNPEFVKEILEARNEMKSGKGTTMTLKEIDQLWK